MRASLLCGVLLALGAQAQLIPTGAPIPKTTLPPVVFINGFQFTGCPTTFANTFGIADQVLQSNGEASVFFNTCSLSSSATIEDLAAAFATFLSGLSYTDGQPVEQVDVVAHSMGGLVLRCYLSGKQNTAGMFQPPAATLVRKAVFLATPHAGTGIASLVSGLLGNTNQLQEMSSGSAFLFDLDTWNDATDDLRGVDAVAAAGNAGSGGTGAPAGFDDGVVSLTSASLQFYMPGRTRVVPYCHIDGSGIVSIFGLCPSNAKGIADIDSASHNSAQIIVSFLNGTSDWQSVGTAADSDPFLSADGGLIIAAHAADDSNLTINAATANSQKLGTSSDHLAFTDQIAAGPLTLNVTSGSVNINTSVTLAAGGTEPYIVKAGPVISRVLPAAANEFPLILAPRMLIAIYGSTLAQDLADAQVSVSGSPITLYFASPAQVNGVLPNSASGLTPLTVQDSSGQNTVNIYVGTAAPSIFTQDQSGSGPAAARKASDESLVTADNPLHSGDSVALFATGLGLTTAGTGTAAGLQVAIQQPTVTVAGMDCPVSFAGAAPGFIGLDQINCAIPSGIASTTSAPVVITSGTMASNTATLAIQ
jgi:uncharacterized protein (TIGR03437 family)